MGTIYPKFSIYPVNNKTTEFGGFQGRGVLGLVGIELISFTAAHIVLCFRVVTKTVLIRTNVLAIAAVCQGLLCFSSAPKVNKATGGQEVGRQHSWDS